MRAYLFDVDGVLSDPVEKQVIEIGLFDQIILRLQNHQPVALNTGRSTQWLIERFVNPFLQKISDKTILTFFMVVGEKGGTWITFDEKGTTHHGKSEGITIPERINKEVAELVKQKYSDSMFFDTTKETMLSVEMSDGFDIDAFHQKRQAFVEDLLTILEKEGVTEKYKIDPSNISTDVESIDAGKGLGANRFLQFLDEKKVNPSEFETFGDSKSDFAMSDELYRKGKKVKMIYVGDRGKLGKIIKEYPVDYVGRFSQGTLHYLQTH
jgi:hypothetical protein